MKKLIVPFFLGISFLFLFFATPAYAQKGGQANTKIGTGGSDDVLCETVGINTAIGCIKVLGGEEEFLGQLLGWAIGVGGGIAFLLIVYAGFMIMTSSGNPERLKAGQELLTSAISGIVLLVFSVMVLNLIGVKILNLEQFGFGK